MNDAARRLWPFGPRANLVSAAVFLVGLLVLIASLRAILGWPTAQSDNAVLIGVLLLSLLPILLALLDIIIERGAVIEYGGVKVDFSQKPSIGDREHYCATEYRRPRSGGDRQRHSAKNAPT